MIYRIEVWIKLAVERVLAGEMVCEIVSGSRNRGGHSPMPSKELLIIRLRKLLFLTSIDWSSPLKPSNVERMLIRISIFCSAWEVHRGERVPKLWSTTKKRMSIISPSFPASTIL